MPFEVKIPCPKCKQPELVKARDALPGSLVPCPRCGADVRLDGDDIRRAQAALDDLKNAFGKFKK